ncbi:MAG: response regulator transcription factor [Rhizobacter sp.]|nr:response regulator transcription factor [Chlorobiales bacterium]
MKKVLLIDDDLSLGRLLAEYFAKFEIATTHAALPSKAMEMLAKETFDAIVLDVMLPEMDGFKVAQQIRQTIDTPIIMLTARGDVHDRIVGLEMGADDYLPKPFEPRELVARIQSVLRRTVASVNIGAATGDGKFKAGPVVIDTKKFTAAMQGKELELTTTEFELLKLLAQNEGKVLSREFIMHNTKGIQWESYDRTIDVLVSKVRAKLGDDAKNPRYLKTIWGRGYVFMSTDD